MFTKEYEFDDDICTVNVNNIEVFKGRVIDLYQAMENAWKNNIEILNKYHLNLNDEKNDIGAYFDDMLDHYWNDNSKTYKKDNIEITVFATT